MTAPANPAHDAAMPPRRDRLPLEKGVKWKTDLSSCVCFLNFFTIASFIQDYEDGVT
jgi:hypothetical protein